MGDLQVTVRYHDVIVEDRILAVRSVVRIGDAPHAKVAFPGASVLICRVGGDLDIRGRRLKEGQRTGFSLGAVHVEVEHIEPLRGSVRMHPPVDPRFLMVAMGVTVGGMWLDLADALFHNPPDGAVAEWSAAARRTLHVDPDAGPRVPAERIAAVQPNNDALRPVMVRVAGEGREAAPDDDETHWGYYQWYRRAVPSTIEAELARIRLASAPDDIQQHALVARGSYDNDNFREALHHYQWLAEREPDNLSWWLGVAQAQKRLGMHRAELDTYERVLTQDPANLIALGNQAVAMARLGDYEAAEERLERAQQLAPGHPYVHVFLGIYQAIRGREVQAIAELEEAIAGRTELPEALQLELRRDLAIDPVLKPLRADPRLRSALYRHLGAAAPRPVR
ncbi:MAG: tetratricopeptide repeat protein [Alphaproteobacteria bacterium]|nr:tetratricopeptide repeat protein [Alphaproteobacteria bacterium]